MFLHEIELRNFRCFKKKIINFEKQVTLIIGNNGIGKTSIVEAIHYLSYLKSFRTSINSDLLLHGESSFFLKGSFSSFEDPDILHGIQVGYANKKKGVKLDNKVVHTYKDIFEIFQVITLLEDDIELIKGYPSGRRSFIDQSCLFLDADYLDTYRKFKKVIQSRNALLYKGFLKDPLELEVWTKKLWTLSVKIQKQRIDVLKKIESVVNNFLQTYFDDIYKVSINYESKYIQLDETYDFFKKNHNHVFSQEIAMKRSLFGAHLDDFIIKIKGQKARSFASRGQQKLISLLCKLSLIVLVNSNDFAPIILIDDFIADFDKKRLSGIINYLISCKNQIIITTPFYEKDLEKIIQKADPDVISIEK